MSGYNYKLLKFSELGGQYQGANGNLEQYVDAQLVLLAQQNWTVHTFSVHYIGGHAVYTFLLHTAIGEVLAVPEPQLPVPVKNGLNGTEAVSVINPPSLASLRSRPTTDMTTDLRMPEEAERKSEKGLLSYAQAGSILPLAASTGPTVGERVSEIRRNIENSNGIEYYRRALELFDASLKARVKLEKIPAEAIALRALKHRDKKNEQTLQFALCWLSEYGYNDHALSTLLPEAALALTEIEAEAATRPITGPKDNNRKAIFERMSSRFDLPEHNENKPPRSNRSGS